MNRHSRITERVEKKNSIMRFTPETTNATKKLCKEYARLYDLYIWKQLGKLNEGDNWDLMVRLSNFGNSLKQNPQTKDLNITLATYHGFDNIYNTALNQFVYQSNIPLF